MFRFDVEKLSRVPIHETLDVVDLSLVDRSLMAPLILYHLIIVPMCMASMHFIFEV